MSHDKAYAQRKKLCEQHMQEDAVLLADGAYHRFCFSCGKMQALECFEGKHRNCRAKLLKRRKQNAGSRESSASPALAAAPEPAAHALATQPPALELPLGVTTDISHGVPATWQLLPPAVSNDSSSNSVVTVPAAHNGWPQQLALAGSAPATPVLHDEPALEVMLEAELAAAGLHDLLAASTGARSTSSSTPLDDGHRELSWQLAAAVVENSLGQPDIAADPCLLQWGTLDVRGGYHTSPSSGASVAAAFGSNAVPPACAVSAAVHSDAPQLAATAAAAWCHPAAASPTAAAGGSNADGVAQQMARLGYLQAQVAALHAQTVALQARAHSLGQRLAMCPA